MTDLNGWRDELVQIVARTIKSHRNLYISTAQSTIALMNECSVSQFATITGFIKRGTKLLMECVSIVDMSWPRDLASLGINHLLETVEFLANEICFRCGIGQRDGAAERLARVIFAVQALQEMAAQSMEVEVAAKVFAERFDELERRFRTIDL